MGALNKLLFMRSSLESLDSPCIRRCTLNAADVCVGCGRSLEEIKQWWEADKEEQSVILTNASQRLENLKRR